MINKSSLVVVVDTPHDNVLFTEKAETTRPEQRHNMPQILTTATTNNTAVDHVMYRSRD